MIILSTKIFVYFNLSHSDLSDAEAYNVKVVFYFPIYVSMNAIEDTNSSFTFSTNDSAVFFKVI